MKTPEREESDQMISGADCLPVVNPAPSRVLLVEDHPLMRYGFKSLLSRHSRFHVCGEADSTRQALELVTRFSPDLALVDISLKSANGIELTKDIRILSPCTQVLVVSVHEENIYAERALRAGAMGYLMKNEATETLVTAIDSVLRGDVFVSKTIGERIVRGFVNQGSGTITAPIDLLSNREIVVLRLIGTGNGNREMAARLNLSVKTIDSFKQHLRLKLNLASGADLIRYAIEWMKLQP